MASVNNAGNPDDVPKYLSPYEVWNFGKGVDYALPGIRRFTKFISALAEFPPRGDGDPSPAEVPGRLPTLWKHFDKPKRLTFLPFVVENPDAQLINNPGLLQKLLRGGLRFLSGHRLTTFNIEDARFRVAFPIPDNAMKRIDQLEDPDCTADAGLRDRIKKGGRITIMAVIDDGLPFAHRNFRDASGEHTRVEFCWLQSVAADKDNKTVLFGREYTRKQIDKLIGEHGDDEDALYQAADALLDTEGQDLGSLLTLHATHGAHVMDLATGYAPDRDYAPERGERPPEEIRIIAVQLPNTIALDTSGFGKDMYILSAFHYIFNRADVIAKCYGINNLRLVINFSYGFSGGRHDGETELEAAIDEMIEARRAITGPTALVVAAGNTFLDRLHGEIRESDFKKDATDPKKDVASFSWRIQPNDRTPSYLELWFRQDFDTSGYTVALSDPRSQPQEPFSIKPVQPTSPGPDPCKVGSVKVDEKEVGQISADMHRADGKVAVHKTGRLRVLVILAPSEPEDDSLPGIEAGTWTVKIEREAGAKPLDAPIHCWIQRADDPGTLRSGSRQSYFDDPRDVGYNDDGSRREEDTEGAFVRRFGSLNGLATGCTSLVVGGYRLGGGMGSSLKSALPAPYSAAGPLDYEWLEAEVACSSMSDRSKVLFGTVAAGVRSGSCSLLQGTSAAAPFVARQLAEAFVREDDGPVKRAARENYRTLLAGEYGGNDAERRARLGDVLVPPHRQPGVEVKLLV